jgi:hypothetical protein
MKDFPFTIDTAFFGQTWTQGWAMHAHAAFRDDVRISRDNRSQPILITLTSGRTDDQFPHHGGLHVVDEIGP